MGIIVWNGLCLLQLRILVISQHIKQGSNGEHLMRGSLLPFCLSFVQYIKLISHFWQGRAACPSPQLSPSPKDSSWLSWARASCACLLHNSKVLLKTPSTGIQFYLLPERQWKETWNIFCIHWPSTLKVDKDFQFFVLVCVPGLVAIPCYFRNDR